MSSIIGSAMDQSVTQVMMDKALRIIIHALDNIEACMRAGEDEKMAPSIPRLGGSMQSLAQSHSFLYDHQVEDHSGAPPDFTLHSKRYYGRDRLACQVAEGVSLKLRTGKILNSKSDFEILVHV